MVLTGGFEFALRVYRIAVKGRVVVAVTVEVGVVTVPVADGVVVAVVVGGAATADASPPAGAGGGQVVEFGAALFAPLLVVVRLAPLLQPSLPQSVHTVAAPVDAWAPHTLKKKNREQNQCTCSLNVM